MIFFFTIPLLLIMVLIILGAAVLGIGYMWIQAHLTIIITIIAIINLIIIILCVFSCLLEGNKILGFFEGLALGVALSAVLDFFPVFIYGVLWFFAAIFGWA